MRAAPAPATEVVKYSLSNSEHIVPSHNIKDIIKQYQTPPPEPVPEMRRWVLPVQPCFRFRAPFRFSWLSRNFLCFRKEGRGFMKKMNPHDEAMQILKTQMENPPPPQVLLWYTTQLGNSAVGKAVTRNVGTSFRIVLPDSIYTSSGICSHVPHTNLVSVCGS